QLASRLTACLVLVVLAARLGGAEPAAAPADALHYLYHIVLADRAIAANDLARAESLLEGCPPAQRRWEWYHLEGRCQARSLSLPKAGRCVALSPDGKQLAAGDDGIRLLDAVTGKELRHFTDDQVSRITQVVFRPDGKHVAGISHNAVGVWDVA